MIQFGNKEAASIYIGGKEVQKIEIGGKTAYEKETIDYFYVQNEYEGTNTITLKATKTGSPSSSLYTDTIEYSKDKTNWTTVTLSTSTPTTITMDQGEKVYFRNDNGKFNYVIGSDRYRTTFTASQNHSAGGNVMSLLDYTNMSTVSLTPGSFWYLFGLDNKLIDCSNIELPATTLAENCYSSMFEGTSITTPPTLPATTMAAGCYSYMFYNTPLTTAPVLPATTLALNCYSNMFRNTNITTAPVLPATTLAEGCYRSMFESDTSLTTPPVLPATILVQECYRTMFSGCSSLNNITTYANDISSSNCIYNWLYGVANSGTFHNLGSATYTTSSASGIPQGWTEDTSNRFVFSNTVITDVGNNQAQLTSGIQVNYKGTWDDGYFEVYNELDKDRSIHFSPADITNGVLTASNLITESNVATLISPATVTIYNSGTAVWTGSVSFTVVQ